MNETFYFQLAITEKTLAKAEQNDLAEIIIEELRTKPEITISVWGDPNNGQIESLGSARIGL